LGEKFDEADSAGVLLDVYLTQQDLANMIASTREAVAQVMSELQRDGVIGCATAGSSSCTGSFSPGELLVPPAWATYTDYAFRLTL
jgi:Crp-like helix-turn-helix domain